MPNEQEKPKKYEPKPLKIQQSPLVPTPDELQDSFRYGKNVEKLEKKQIRGSFGNHYVGQSSRSTTGTQSFTV